MAVNPITATRIRGPLQQVGGLAGRPSSFISSRIQGPLQQAGGLARAPTNPLTTTRYTGPPRQVSGFAQAPDARQSPTGGANLLAPNVKPPPYKLVRPANAPNSVWAGPHDPGAGYRGVGGGWWAPRATTPKAPQAKVPGLNTRAINTKTIVPGGVRQVGGRLQTGPARATPAQRTAAVAPKPAAPKPATPFNIGLVPADEQAKAVATATYGTDAATQLRVLQNQAMAYGDPSIMAGLNLGRTVDPNSALALAALKSQQTQLADTGARERAGTLFSSLALQDRQNIGAAQQRADLAGYSRYQNALANFNIAMTRAQQARDEAVANANLDERQTALNQLPTAQTTAAGGFQGGTTNIRGKVPVAQQKAPKTGKAPTLKPPKTPKTKSKLPSVGSKKGVTVGKGSKPTSVKKAGSRKGRTGRAAKPSVPAKILRGAQK